ncbi:MAG: hypothetical protein ACR2O5_00300 [Thiogranum sp.]
MLADPLKRSPACGECPITAQHLPFINSFANDSFWPDFTVADRNNHDGSRGR